MTKTSKQAEQVSAFGTVEEPEDVAARRAVDAMVSAGMLDGLLAKVDAGELRLTGDGGFLPEMVKRVLEAGLAAELTDHLGYDKHDPVGRGSGNSRNGSTPKTLGGLVTFFRTVTINLSGSFGAVLLVFGGNFGGCLVAERGM